MKETTKFDDFSGEKAISLAKTFAKDAYTKELGVVLRCLLYTSPSPRDTR